MEAYEFFVYYMMTPIALLLAFFGNLMGILVFAKKKMKKIGPIYIYRFIFISDSIFILQMINPFLLSLTGRNLSLVSNLLCKLTFYLGLGLFSLTPMLLVYISVEKLVSIKYPAKKFLMIKKRWQVAYIIIMGVLGLLVFLPSFFYTSLQIKTMSSFNSSTTQTNQQTSVCTFTSGFGQSLVGIITFVSRVFIAFGSMFMFSILLIISAFQLRRRIVENFLANSNLNLNKKYTKDIKLAITSILLNLAYLVLNVPYVVYLNTPNYYANKLANSAIAFLFYYSFGVNFYLLIISNKLTRKEFIAMITFKK